MPAEPPPQPKREEASPRKRGRPKGRRAEEILEVSVRLFARQGYHQTSIEEIGQAAGMRGPAIYRHFASKDDILVSLIEHSADLSEKSARTIKAAGGSAKEMLERMVCSEVRQGLDTADLLAVVNAELRNLPGANLARALRRIRKNHDAYTELIVALRPNLTIAEARAVTFAAKAMLVSMVTARTVLPRDKLEVLIVDLVLGTIFAPRKATAAMLSRHTTAVAGADTA